MPDLKYVVMTMKKWRPTVWSMMNIDRKTNFGIVVYCEDNCKPFSSISRKTGETKSWRTVPNQNYPFHKLPSFYYKTNMNYTNFWNEIKSYPISCPFILFFPFCQNKFFHASNDFSHYSWYQFKWVRILNQVGILCRQCFL